jgi:hypothetical protein
MIYTSDPKDSNIVVERFRPEAEVMKAMGINVSTRA